MNSTPLVSICCTTYNHEPFIRDAIEGFLMQEVDFPIEILINDDASTDGTPDILREYEQKHPDLIKVVYQTENQYSKGIKPLVHLLIPRARGKYIAVCEGDDFWTNPLKLKKQVAYLESNLGCVLTCGGYIRRGPGLKEEPVLIRGAAGKVNDSSFVFGLGDMRKKWIAKMLTVVFRKDVLDDKWSEKYKHTRDIHLFYHIVNQGHGYCFGDVLGVQNVHEGGVNSMKRGIINKTAFYNCSRELYLNNVDEFTREMYLRSILMLVNHYIYEESDVRMREVAQLIGDAMVLVRNLTDAKWLVGACVKSSVKARMRGAL